MILTVLITFSERGKESENENFDAYWKAKIAPILGSLAMNIENLDASKEVGFILS